MPDRKPPPGESLYRGPSKAPRDKRERERDRSQVRPPERDLRPPDERVAARPPRDAAQPREAAPRVAQEQRWYGVNACLALFAGRPEAVRKVWLLESRIPTFKALLAHCVKNRLGYTVVEAEDLERLSGSAHHEGVVIGAMAAPEASLAAWLQALPPGPQMAIWLDGVGNPHNLGAILRSAAHFGARGVLLPGNSTLALSGAAARVAEGGAEALPLVRMDGNEDAIARLQAAGFVIAATVVRRGQSLHAAALPPRLVLLMGAEQSGVDAGLARASSLKLVIPGTGAVESLNVASATSVLMSEWTRQHGG